MSERFALPSRVRDLLDPVGRKLGLDGAVETGRVFSRWNEVVGPDIAEHAEPTSLKDGVLRVRAESPAWATELGYLAGEISARVNADVGRKIVTEVRVWTGASTKPKARAQPVQAAPRPEIEPVREPETDPLAAWARARRAWANRRAKRPSDQGF